MGKRIYIASKLGEMEEKVRKLKVELESCGHEIIYDWMEYPVAKPFAENISQATVAADNMAKAVMRCDVLVVLTTPAGGVGYHIETGGALVASIVLSYITGQRQKEIYVVGEGNDRSVFYFHDSVVRLSDVSALLETL